MAEHEPLAALGRGAVHAVDDLAVGAADAEPQRLHEQLVRARTRLVDLAEGGAARIAGHDGDGLHVP